MSVVLHLCSPTGGSGAFDEEDLHAHGASYSWALDSMLASRQHSLQRLGIFAITSMSIFCRPFFFPSFPILLLLLSHQERSVSSPVDGFSESYPVRQGSSPGSSPVLQLHLIHEDGRDILPRKLLLSKLPPDDLSRLGL